MVSEAKSELIYPESDGKPMADHTKQFEWIVLIKKNLDLLFQHYPNIFVAGDLLWYPVEGKVNVRVAPDVIVVFGRPKGDPLGVKGAARGAYVQHREGNIPPQVVFEICLPATHSARWIRNYCFTIATALKNIISTIRMQIDCAAGSELRLRWKRLTIFQTMSVLV